MLMSGPARRFRVGVGLPSQRSENQAKAAGGLCLDHVLRHIQKIGDLPLRQTVDAA
jgi:hypothetical protein